MGEACQFLARCGARNNWFRFWTNSFDRIVVVWQYLHNQKNWERKWRKPLRCKDREANHQAVAGEIFAVLCFENSRQVQILEKRRRPYTQVIPTNDEKWPPEHFDVLQIFHEPRLLLLHFQTQAENGSQEIVQGIVAAVFHEYYIGERIATQNWQPYKAKLQFEPQGRSYQISVESLRRQEVVV